MKDQELNKYTELFAISHKNAAIKFCKKHSINVKSIRCTYDVNGIVRYSYEGIDFMLAKMIPTEKSKHPFRTFKAFLPLSGINH